MRSEDGLLPWGVLRAGPDLRQQSLLGIQSRLAPGQRPYFF